ncbi:MAG: aminopeptidase N [Desulfobulbus propionicus]|nr:MAG: aminopeptidase N [Desulfobulbus propionicus]
MTQQKKEIFLKDYRPPAYLVDEVKLRFELEENNTRVKTTLTCRPNGKPAPFQLNGEHLHLARVVLDQKELHEGEYRFQDGILTLPDVPQAVFTVKIETLIDPKANTALEGLYLSSGNYCTQCEPEGFRRITCFPDRPDVMAVFTTTIVADKRQCPVLLANGNLIDQGELEDGRHFATWHDPFKKPSYLFALVAGDLVCIEDSFTTMSGRDILLQIYVEERNQGKCSHAMRSLQKSMLWDEKAYGREYDLDRYMIVAVDDFNMGAMENKGLNVFNSKYVLATPETATDKDYDGIEGVIGHEYFHNWTGNRITCRDWFQLSLKEGLTVFRDQEFSADMGSRAVKRIEDANIIRSFQFREDAGPMSHPVRPHSFVEINNFYTLTVYNKGAEVIRMLHTMLGRQGFRRGMDLYFERHDGCAVTCDDFLQAMADANNFDLSQFQLWYSQAGTPELKIVTQFNEKEKTFTLHIQQTCPPTAETSNKKPFHIPLAIGFMTGNGNPLTPELIGKNQEKAENGTMVLALTDEQQSFVFQAEQEPVVSVLRNFSAPVNIDIHREKQDLSLLMAHDPDPFSRWDAGQSLALQCILEQIERFQSGREVIADETLISGAAGLLDDLEADPAFLAMALTLPSENWIGQQMDTVDPEAVFTVRIRFCQQITGMLREKFLMRYEQLKSRFYKYSPVENGKRALKNCCLSYLLTAIDEDASSGKARMLELGVQQYQQSDNMTDRIASLQAVVNLDLEKGEELLDDFYLTWKTDPLVMDKWLMIQAGCSLPGTLQRVKNLTKHEVFSFANPNKVRSLIATFCSSNHAQFHALNGQGYEFLTETVRILDPKNPQIAARLLTPFTFWQRYDTKRQQLIKKQLNELAATDGLSDDATEVVTRSLQ